MPFANFFSTGKQRAQRDGAPQSCEGSGRYAAAGKPPCGEMPTQNARQGLFFVRMKCVTEQERMAGQGKPVIGRENILGYDSRIESPTRAELGVVAQIAVVSRAAGREKTIAGKTPAEAIRVKRQCGIERLAHQQERTAHEQFAPNVRLYRHVCGEETIRLALCFQRLSCRILRPAVIDAIDPP